MNYISSISNPSPGKFLVCKSPIENFNDNSILTVNPGELAIFVNCGEVAGIFANGRYELTSQNYPFINAFRRFLANGQLTYLCSVYFISETQSAEVLWGFSLPVRDPIQGIFTKVFVRGSYTLRVKDGGRLLTTLMGMNINFMAASDIKSFFGNKFQQYISNSIAQHISTCGKEVLEICADNLSLAQTIEPKLEELIMDTGLTLSNFSISAMDLDANDPNRQILETAYARKREIEILGNNYNTVKDTDVRINASQTSFAGMSFGNPSGVSNQQPTSPIVQQQPVNQPIVQNSSSLNTDSNTGAEDIMSKLTQLNKLLEAGLINQDDYDKTKANLLSKML